jgi:hypothetical protein
MVYHLFGKLSASPTYAISDEDLLEYICAKHHRFSDPRELGEILADDEIAADEATCSSNTGAPKKHSRSTTKRCVTLDGRS